MKYKGYTARIEFDDSDNIFVGRVLGVRAIIGFHGETVEKLRGDFISRTPSILCWRIAKRAASPRKKPLPAS